MKTEYINTYRAFIGCMVPNWLCERTEVSYAAKVTYGRLCQHAGTDGHCFPSRTKLAFEIGCSLESVKLYLKELKSFGLLEWRSGNTGRSNTYLFPKHAWMKLEMEGGGVGVESYPKGGRILPTKRISKEEGEANPGISPQVPPETLSRLRDLVTTWEMKDRKPYRKIQEGWESPKL